MIMPAYAEWVDLVCSCGYTIHVPARYEAAARRALDRTHGHTQEPLW